MHWFGVRDALLPQPRAQRQVDLFAVASDRGALAPLGLKNALGQRADRNHSAPAPFGIPGRDPNAVALYIFPSQRDDLAPTQASPKCQNKRQSWLALEFFHSPVHELVYPFSWRCAERFRINFRFDQTSERILYVNHAHGPE